jgi:uncharacterized protein YdaU (DUF1376 family)
MAYTRLIRAYYRRERPIADEKEAIKLARAVTAKQKLAVTNVLQEFFTKCNDGFKNKRCDEEILKYQAQSSTNRRIARERTVNDSSTKRTPNHKPVTSSHIKATSKAIAPDKSDAKKIGLKELLDLGVPEQAAVDWLTVRKAKKAPLTQTALDGIEREGRKAGLTIAQVVTICASRNWQSFKASWEWQDGRKLTAIDIATGKGNDGKSERDDGRVLPASFTRLPE